ncbi:hypothetical protein EYF80_024279 [Liparis tanakae]|uniref:Uncharacterized protein n=1 Tax=Liparis tanakae TaxID=230148 RepID=A0A4Z2HIU1_9TELE|nr:hypothetical protein EYF80_024279 [Liparis tanakae]
MECGNRFNRLPPRLHKPAFYISIDQGERTRRRERIVVSRGKRRQPVERPSGLYRVQVDEGQEGEGRACYAEPLADNETARRTPFITRHK